MTYRTTIAVLFVVATVVSLTTTVPANTTDATPAASPIADSDQFSPEVTNPYFPLASIAHKVLEGDFTDPDTGETVHERVEERVLPDTAMVSSVEVTVVEVMEYADDELTEYTLDYYAQHHDGTVYYFGEDVDVYEDGQVVGHEGAWRAGENGNLPGVFMPGVPGLEDRFEQERAPGVAEDISTVVAVEMSITVPAGSFNGCIRTEDINPLDDSVEHKIYCPDTGIVQEESDDGAIKLVSLELR